MDNNITSTCFANKDLKDGISVIIPTHKREKIITKCLDSLNKQTLSKSLFEVIIIINGEKDNTKSVINNFSLETGMDNIKVLEIDEGSASLARNEGILYASRKYSVFVDDDDYISENYLEEMYRYASEDTIVVSQIIDIDQNGKMNRNNPINLQIRKCEKKRQKDIYDLDKVSTINACKLLPTKYLKMIKYDHELKSGEDIVFFVKLLLEKDFKFEVLPIDKQVIYYRKLMPNSISRQEFSFDFFVKQRLEVINKLNQLLISANSMKKVKFVKNKIDSQFVFIYKYALKRKTEQNKIINEIKNYDFIYIPSLMNNNGLFNRLKFYVQLLKKPKILIKLLLNK